MIPAAFYWLTVGLALLAFMAVVTLGRTWWVVLAFGALLVTAYVSQAAMLGRPLPLSMSLAEPQDAKVAYFLLREDEGIYLLVVDGPVPTWMVWPWDVKMAIALQEASRKIKQDGGELYLSEGDSGGWKAYPKPQAALPPKVVN